MSTDIVTVFIGDDESQRRSFRLTETTTARDILVQICEKLQIAGDQCFFALFTTNSDGSMMPLTPETLLLQLPDPRGRLTFRMLYFMAPTEIPADPELRRFEYNQSRNAVVSGVFPLSEPLLISLAGLSMLETFGPNKESQDKNFIKGAYEKHMPAWLVKSRRPDQLIEGVLQEYQRCSHDDNAIADPRAAYLSILKNTSYYGMTLFNCKHANAGARRLCGRLVLGVSNRGIHFFDPGTAPAPTDLIETHFWPYSSIFSWGKSPQAFAFNTDELGGARYTVETKDAATIAAVAHGYVQLIVYAITASKQLPADFSLSTPVEAN